MQTTVSSLALPEIGDEVYYKDFGGCTIAKSFDDGSVDIDIPGLGIERVAHGQWMLKECRENRSAEGTQQRRALDEQERMQLRDEADKAMEALLRESTTDMEDSWVSPAAANSWLSRKQLQGRRNHQVWLHIYDLDIVIQKLNDYGLRAAGMGAYHCGVEVLGEECFFSWGDDSNPDTGVLLCEPKSHQVHVYKESIDMGKSPLTEGEIQTVITKAMEAWPASSYHIVNRNCVHFAEDLLQRLKVPEPFPVWIRGAADAGKNSLVQPIANWGWRWMKYYYSETPQRASADDEPGALSCFCAQPRKTLVEDANGNTIKQ